MQKTGEIKNCGKRAAVAAYLQIEYQYFAIALFCILAEHPVLVRVSFKNRFPLARRKKAKL